MITASLAVLRAFQRPIWENTFSCAFSRIEQVLIRMTSASNSLSVSSRPCSAASTSAILAESYTFIWQPWVLMYSLPGAAGPGRGISTGFPVMALIPVGMRAPL